MQKMYSKTLRGNGVIKQLVPKVETIKFLLDYSMALSVIECQNKKYELLLN